MQFINSSPTPYHAVDKCREWLATEGAFGTLGLSRCLISPAFDNKRVRGAEGERGLARQAQGWWQVLHHEVAPGALLLLSSSTNKQHRNQSTIQAFAVGEKFKV